MRDKLSVDLCADAMSPLSSLQKHRTTSFQEKTGLTSAVVEAGNRVQDSHLISTYQIQPATSSLKATDRSHHEFVQSAIPAPSRSTANPSTSSEDSGVRLVRRKPRHDQDCSPPSLFLLCLESVALNIKHVESLSGLPSDIVLMLFWVSITFLHPLHGGSYLRRLFLTTIPEFLEHC